MKTRKIWSHSELEKLKEIFPNNTTEFVAKYFNTSASSVNGQAYKLNLNKTEEYLNGPNSGRMLHGDTRGLSTRFKKGNVPVNKGKGMSQEIYDKCKATMFKKGNKPHNTKFNGCLSIRKDSRTNKTYLYIRISDSNWVEYHRYLWENEFGKIPSSLNLVFKDGNTSNITIDNLELISNAELMRRNTIQRFPEDLKKAIRALTKLKK